MEVSPLIYIALLILVIVGPVLAIVSFNGLKKIWLGRTFLIISALAVLTLIIINMV